MQQLTMNELQIIQLLTLLCFCLHANSTELTFELPDKRKDCFYETFEAGEKAQLDFRVISGGNYDIDVRLLGPDDEAVYQTERRQNGGHVFPVTKSGTYRVCFSNEFSTFAHKLVFFVLRSGREAPAGTDEAAAGPDGPLAAALLTVRASLATVSDYQRHFRINEAADRLAAEATGSRVFAWAAFETLAVMAIGVGQVIALRRLFPATRRVGVRLAGSSM